MQEAKATSKKKGIVGAEEKGAAVAAAAASDAGLWSQPSIKRRSELYACWDMAIREARLA